jgi:hypothetical protein
VTDKGKVAVAWCYGMEVASMFQTSMQMMFNHDLANDNHISLVVAEHAHVNITHVRNNIMRKFMVMDEVDWLLMLDTDMVVPENLIDILLEDADPDPMSPGYTPFIGGLCFSINGEAKLYPTMYRWTGPEENLALEVINDYVPGSMVEVDATGAACLLMHKDALGRIAQASGGDIFPWFKEFEYKGTALSEDFGLMRRAADLGFTVRVNTKASIGHFKPFVLSEDIYLHQQEAERALAASKANDEAS